MATYKVPQDVEADDKLLGPFSFKQFIYLIIAAMGIVIAWGLSKIFVGLVIIPLPVIILFTAIALPLRKDQPTEIYLAAILSFYLKPRKRLWKADGVQSLVEIVAPKVVEEKRTNGLSEIEAEKRLSYLANIVDTRGWAVRGVGASQMDNAMQANVFFEAQQTEDMLDDSSTVTHAFDSMIDRADVKRRQEALDLMNKPAAAAQIPPTPDPYASLTLPSIPALAQNQPEPVTDPHLVLNPYPAAMRQSVIQPMSAQPQPEDSSKPAHSDTQPASNEPVSPDIINLANNSDLSIETLAHEAKRIREKEEADEVVISLR